MRLRNSEKGVAAVELGLILSLVTLVTISSLSTIGWGIWIPNMQIAEAFITGGTGGVD